MLKTECKCHFRIKSCDQKFGYLVTPPNTCVDTCYCKIHSAVHEPLLNELLKCTRIHNSTSRILKSSSEERDMSLWPSSEETALYFLHKIALTRVHFSRKFALTRVYFWGKCSHPNLSVFAWNILVFGGILRQRVFFSANFPQTWSTLSHFSQNLGAFSQKCPNKGKFFG